MNNQNNLPPINTEPPSKPPPLKPAQIAPQQFSEQQVSAPTPPPAQYTQQPFTPPASQQYAPAYSPSFVAADDVPHKGKGKGKKALVTLLIVFAVLLAASASAYAFRDQIILLVQPELYLLNAINKTVTHATDGESLLSQTAKFADGPVSHELELSLDNIDNPLIRMMGNIRVALSARTDWQNSSLMLGADVHSTFLTLQDNRLYLSPGTVALSVPAYLKQYGFISADTKSFAKDWNLSSFAKASYVTLPEELDIYGSLEGFFTAVREAVENSSTSSSEYLAKEIEGSVARFIDAASISHEGKVKRNSVEYEHFICTIPKEDVLTFVCDSFEIFAESYKENLSNLSELALFDDYYYQYYIDGIDEMLAIANEISLNKDVSVNLYVCKDGYIRILDVAELEYKVPESIGAAPANYSLLFSANLAGEASPFDDLTIAAEYRDINADITHSLELTHTGAETGEFMSSDWGFAFESTYWEYTERGNIFCNFRRNKKNQNIKLDMGIDNGYNNMTAELSGVLVETDDLIQLSNAKLKLKEDAEELLALSLGYKCQPVAASDVSLDGETVTDLFSISLSELELLFSALPSLSL